MEWLTAPFEATFVQRALWGGILVSAICALAGTWVVLRGMAFLGDAMSHGLLPGWHSPRCWAATRWWGRC